MTSVGIGCAGCGRTVAKATRRYAGKRYCATCYGREFKPRACPQCGTTARMPRSDERAVCSKCEKKKPCVRCGKTTYAIGCLTAYGPACSACAVYFRAASPCDLCGAPTQRFETVNLGGQRLRVCLRCARQQMEPCPACHQRRPLQDTADGRRLCKRCAEHGHRPCASCGAPVPGGAGRTCFKCLILKTARKRIDMGQAALNSPILRSAFAEFGQWLVARTGPNKAARNINRYLGFFVEIDQAWGNVPCYADLLERFGAEGLRRVRLPMAWLGEARGVVADGGLKKNDSERRRSTALMVTFPAGTLANDLLAKYGGSLLLRAEAGEITLASVRLALRPAVSLLQLADRQGHKLPRQTTLDRYLLKTPGQLAAVTGFVGFLNRDCNLHLRAEMDPKRSAGAKKRRLEQVLIKMMQKSHRDSDDMKEWLRVALEYFHGVRLPREDAVNWREADGWAAINVVEQTYRVPLHALQLL